MKKYIIAAIAAIFAVNNATAQSEARVNSQAAVAALASSTVHASGCADVYVHTDDNGLVDKVKVEPHSGFTVGAYGGYSHIEGESDDLGKSSANAVEYGASVAYSWHKKNSPMGVELKAYFGSSTSVKIETLKTQSYAIGLQPILYFNPCGTIQPYLFGDFAYVNSTSKSVIDTEYVEGELPWKSNPFNYGAGAGLKIKLGTIKSTRKINVGGQNVQVIKARPIRLTIGGKYTWSTVDKPHIDESRPVLKMGRLTGQIGLEFVF